MLLRTEQLRRDIVDGCVLEHVLACAKAKISCLKPLACGLVECEQLRQAIEIRDVVDKASSESALHAPEQNRGIGRHELQGCIFSIVHIECDGGCRLQNLKLHMFNSDGTDA